MTDARGGPPAGRWDVHFEETLSLKDRDGAKRLVKSTRVAVAVMVVVTLVSIVLVAAVAAFSFSSAVGGFDVALTIVSGMLSERPVLVAGILGVGLLIVGVALVSIVGFVRQTGRAFDEQVHVRVTDAGLTVERTGGGYWRSSGVEIPFEAITAVEYLDPEESSFRVELGDVRSKQFFAGRSRSWVRIDRDGAPAVYVGSDRPVALAEAITQRTPGVGNAVPF